MSDATDLWTAVLASYESQGLVTLTNIRDPSEDSVDTTVGNTAAQSVIDLWPIYAQETYDSTDAAHVEVGMEGVIALLWRRGGSATGISEVKWDKVFGSEGMISKVRRTGPRARQSPSSNSGVTQSVETVNGRRTRPWSDRASLPVNFYPNRTISED